MSGCGCRSRPAEAARETGGSGPCRPPVPSHTGAPPASPALAPTLAWFADMVGHCHAEAVSAKAAGRPVVGILCEYTPRELILAAGGLPVCLCGGDAGKIPAAEAVLPSNLCPLIKSTFGYHLTGTNPFLEMADLVVAETTCDGKKKMYELMAESRPMHVLELPQKPGDPGAFAHWLAELGKLRAELERRFGERITDDRLRGAIRAMNRERALRRGLAERMRRNPPPFTGRELLDLKSLISCLPADVARYEQALATVDAAPGRSDLRGRVRVLLTGVPVVHMAERVVDLIEDRGGLIVAMENCTGLKPILEDVDETAPDPLQAIAEKYFHLPCSVMTPNDGRLDVLRRLATDYRPGAVIELIWQACLTYDVESHRVKRMVETELGLPYLRIETDYSPSDSARIALRVEALFETVRARHGARESTKS
ncbi:MAG: 2-hydroxyacyl-CoA dehydratase family protein [Verrucomicrobia bacterium]|nr:2-hydroxyacyl-CoA dehydratase family protein [Verrucomicrobiota bacterium]